MRHVLYLDANQLTAYRWQGGAVRDEARFPASGAGLEAFYDFLRQHSHGIYYLLADVAEEGFQFDAVPYVLGRDRKALLERKLGQLFYGSPFTLALSQGREKTGRRDEKILFTALTRAAAFDPWLGCLRTAEARLAGLFSTPLVGAALLRKLPGHGGTCLLVSMTRGGVRQTFFEDGRLRFSRLSPLAGSSVHELATTCSAESAKIHQYLVGQRLVSVDQPLPVLVLAHPAHRQAFAERLRAGEELHFEIVDLHAAARACGLATPPADSFSEPLLVHLLAARAPDHQYAPPEERRFFRLWQLRRAALGGAAAALAVCLATAAGQGLEYLSLKRDTAATLADVQGIEQRYAFVLRGLPAMTTSVDNLRAVIGRYDELQRRSAPPEALLARLGSALAQAPAVEIERLEWMLAPSPDAAAETATPGEMHAIVLVAATLPAAEQRRVLEAVNAFVALLRRDPALRVTVMKLPFDIDSAKALRGGADAAASAEPARFALRVSQRL